MSSRNANEKRFKQWEEMANGRRRYSRRVLGQLGWYAIYIKEIDSDENTLLFRQEIYNEDDTLVEVHEKYPIDKGHQKIE